MWALSIIPRVHGVPDLLTLFFLMSILSQMHIISKHGANVGTNDTDVLLTRSSDRLIACGITAQASCGSVTSNYDISFSDCFSWKTTRKGHISPLKFNLLHLIAETTRGRMFSWLHRLDSCVCMWAVVSDSCRVQCVQPGTDHTTQHSLSRLIPPRHYDRFTHYSSANQILSIDNETVYRARLTSPILCNQILQM